MKRILLLLLVLASTQLFAQQNSYAIFKNSVDFQNHLVQSAVTVELDDVEYQKLLQDEPTHLKLNIPISASQTIEVDLEENHILADDFIATSQSANGEQPFNYQPGLYYKGKIVGHPNSLVAISFFDDEIIGVFSHVNGTGSFVIGSYLPDETYDASAHIIYNDANMLIQNNFSCHTSDNVSNLPHSTMASGAGFSSSSNTFGPIEIYIEADHQVYLDNSSNLTTTNNFITGFFNVSATLYANSSITTVISQTTVWQISDPYPSSTSNAALDAFAQATQNSFNGDLAHFVSSVNAGNGGLAWVNVICADYNSSSFYGPYAYSNIDNTYSNFPTYSWTVTVFAHETGHNVASPHTHSCSWNGNNTQIDDCGNIASSSPNACYNSGSPIVPSGGGTIMSYCHLNTVGTNMNFHPQVETLMQNAVINAVCVGSAPYCESEGTTNGGEWIDSVAVNTIANHSGDNGGYANYRHLSTTLQTGTNYSLSLTPGFSGQTWPEYFKVWIDYNQDEDFNDAGEEIFSSGPHTSTATGTFTVPNGATLGNTRMRVSMQYNTLPDTCGSYSFGEVEDYTVTIATNSTVTFVNAATTNVACNGANNGSIDITVSGGTPPYSYSWSNNATTEDISNLSPGTYSCTITDANNGTTTTGNITVTEPANLVANVSVTQPLCAGTMGSATAAPSGGTSGYSYSWSNGSTTNTASSLMAGNSYTVTVTDANNCTATQTISINSPTAITSSGSVTNASCNGLANGSIVLTVNNAVGSASYSWSNNSINQNLSNVGAGSYTVTVTDANNCTHTNTFTVTEPAAITSSVSITQPLCNNGTGSLTASASGGAGGFSYVWTGGVSGSTLSNASPGSYTVTITDANNCTTTNSATITAPPAIGLSGAAVNTSCFGTSDGSINITATNTQGNTTYSWSNNTSMQNPSNLPAGSYTVTVTDGNGCTASSTFTVTSPSQIVPTVTVTQPVCSYDLGSATASATGGVSGYMYAWSNNTTGSSTSNLAAGSVTVTVTDVNGCTSTTTSTVNAPPAAITSSNTVTDVLCNGDANGSVSLAVSNAVMPVTYAWSGSAMTTSTITNLIAGTYDATVTDANNCIFTTSATVTEPAALGVSASVGQHACNGNDGSINVVATGGTAPYTITPSSLSNLAQGSYTVSVTDANGCPTVTSTVDLEGAPVSAFDTSIVDRTVTFTNNSQNGNSYLWVFGDGNQSTADNPTYTYQSSGDFTAMLITTNSCGSDTASIDITVYLVGTETIYDDKRVSIYPNPTSDLLNIDFNINGNWMLKVYDITGRLVKSKDLGDV